MAKQEKRVGSTTVELDSRTGFWIIENGFIRVKLHSSTGCFDVLDKATGVNWGHDPWIDACGELVVSRHGQLETCNLSSSLHRSISPVEKPCKGVALTLHGPVTRQGEALASISLRLQVLVSDGKPDVVIKIAEISNNNPEITIEALRYPLRQFYIKSVYDEGYIVVPVGRGYIVPSRFEVTEVMPKTAPNSRLTRQCYFSETQDPAMAWFGAAKGQSSFVGIIHDRDDVRLNVVGNEVFSSDSPHFDDRSYRSMPRTRLQRLRGSGVGGFTPRISVVSPEWLMSFGRLAYERSITYHFIPDGDHVSMAKYFRRYAIEKGLFKSLEEKAKENPQVERLKGAPWIALRCMTHYPFDPAMKTDFGALYDGTHILHFSFKDVQNFIEELHEIGVDRAFIMVRGWQPNGWDNLHPDIWPPNEDAGGTEELAKVCTLTEKHGYILGFWDNYIDMYADAPSYGDHHIMKCPDGSLYPGGAWSGGRAWFLCPIHAMDFVRRNVPKVVKHAHPNAYHVDVETAIAFRECYDPKHPLTRSGDRKYRIDLLSYLKDTVGIVTSENGFDWAVPFVHCFGYGSFGGKGVPAPLFELVFHDAAIRYRHSDFEGGFPVPKRFYPQNLEYAECTLNWLLRGDTLDLIFYEPMSEADKDMIKELYRLVCKVHREVGFDEMEDHKFITEDFTVQKTTFSSGTEIIVNFGLKDYELEDGKTVPLHGFYVTGPKLGTMIGRFETKLHLSATE